MSQSDTPDELTEAQIEERVDQRVEEILEQKEAGGTNIGRRGVLGGLAAAAGLGAMSGGAAGASTSQQPMALGGDLAVDDAYQIAGNWYAGPESAKPAEPSTDNPAFWTVTDARGGQVLRWEFWDGSAWSQTGQEVKDLYSESINTEELSSETRNQVSRDATLSNGVDLRNITFKRRRVFRPEQPLAGGFEFSDLDFQRDHFTAGTNVLKTTVLSGSESSTSISGGQLDVTNSTGAISETFYTTGAPPVPFVGFEARVESWSSSGSTDSSIEMGLVKDGSNRRQIVANPNSGNWEVAWDDGTNASFSNLATLNASPPFDVRATFAIDRVTVYVDDGSGWYFVGTDSLGVQLKDQATLADHEAGFGYKLEDTESISISKFRTYLPEGTGLRDPSVVLCEDGTPYRDGGGGVYITFTAPLGSEGAPDAYQAVWRLDPHSFEMEQTGAVFARDGGALYNNHAGCILYETGRDRFSWFGTGFGEAFHGDDQHNHIYVGKTGEDLLHGINIVDVQDANMPGTGDGDLLDPMVIGDGQGGYRGIVKSKSIDDRISIETSDDSFTSGWSTNAGASSATLSEGCRIALVNGEIKALYGQEGVGNGMYIADYPALTNEEEVDVSHPPGHDVAPPWPMVFAVPTQNNTTRYLLVTGDGGELLDGGDFTRGNVHIYEGGTEPTGYESDVRYLVD